MVPTILLQTSLGVWYKGGVNERGRRQGGVTGRHAGAPLKKEERMAENEYSVTLRMKNTEKFEVEVDYRVPHPEYALLMLDTARRALEREIRGLEAQAAMAKMSQQAAVMSAIRRGPGLVKPE